MKNFALSGLIATAIAAPFPALALDDPVIVFPGHLAAADALNDGHWKEWTDFAMQMGAMYGASLGSAKVVKGAPYAAEVVTETSQTLADGNVIAKRKTGSIYRDGEGRTRQETAMPEGRARTVYITDPVANMNYILSPNSKRAVGIAPRALTMRHEGREKQVVRLNGSEIRIEDGKVWIDGKEAGSAKIELSKGGKNIVIENGKITIDGQEIAKGGGNRNVVVKRVESEDGTVGSPGTELEFAL